MLLLALDAFVLMVLLKTITDEEVEFWTAVLIALGTSIGTSVLATVLVEPMGLLGVVLALLISTIILAIAVSRLCGVEIKRAIAIAGGFMLFHVGLQVGMYLIFDRD